MARLLNSTPVFQPPEQAPDLNDDNFEPQEFDIFEVQARERARRAEIQQDFAHRSGMTIDQVIGAIAQGWLKTDELPYIHIPERKAT